MTDLNHLRGLVDSRATIDGIGIPIGPTLRGQAARDMAAALMQEPALWHLQAAMAASGLRINGGVYPPRIAELLGSGHGRGGRRRHAWVLLPSGLAYVHAEISAAAATVGMYVQDAGGGGVTEERRGRFAAAAGTIDWTRRITDLRSLGCIISVSRDGRGHYVTRLHSSLLVDTPPDDGLPVIEAEAAAARAYLGASCAQALAVVERCRRHLHGLIDRGQRWGLGDDLRRLFAGLLQEARA